MVERVLNQSEAQGMTSADLRLAIRSGSWTSETIGLCLGHLQANLAVVPREDAFDFLLFCQRNPKPCPLIEVVDAGTSYVSDKLAADADLRTDLPRYRVFIEGELHSEPLDLSESWPTDAVAFLLGCSLTFESALLTAGVPLRHIEHGRKIPVYVTDRPCAPAGQFSGPLVVSMRPVPAGSVAKAVQITSRYPFGHGAPVHIGNPRELGIADLQQVDFGDPPIMERGDVPVFWGCGITPQLAVSSARPRYMISHYPEHMFVSDRNSEEDAVC
jgi:uncharacterized protein YcsI (UPF0317 family)